MSKLPKLNSEYYADITRQIRSGITNISDLTKEKNTLDRMIKSGDYAGQKLHDLNEKLSNVRIKLSQERKDQQRKVKAMCDEFAEELRKEDDLNPADIVDGDLRLLTCGIALTNRDLEAMIARNKTNATMSQLILRYCRENGRKDIELGYIYQGNDDLIRNVNLIPELCRTVLRYDDGMEGGAGHIYNEILGEGSELAEIFSDD